MLSQDLMSMSILRGKSAPHKLHQLCERCNSIFSGSSVLKGLTKKSEHYHFHDNVDTLWQSAASGCHFCALLKSGLPRPGRHADVYKDMREKGEPLYLEIAPRKAKKSLKGTLFLVKCRYNHDHGWSRSFEVRDDSSTRLSPSLAQAETCSAEHTELTRAWIQTCLTRHTSTCGSNSTGHFLPTRLLEIGGFEEDLTVRVHSSSAIDNRLGLQYCTLSHCWGDANVLRLTAANLQVYQQAIPLAELPRTYADALRITRSIGLRYLWIDSLCIIQDSLDDWAHEASAMAMIYANSYCNIAAAAAKDGCYANRDPFLFSPCRIARTTGRELYVHPYLHRGTLKELESNTWSGLFSRAWIMQELLLSPRVLYFGSEGLCFACKKLRADEHSIDGEGHPILDPELLSFHDGSITLRALRSFQWATQSNIPNSNFPHGLHCVWFDIVERYSGLMLSKQGDKLVALSGVAERIIATRRGEEYLAGLWRSTFLSDLLWSLVSWRPRTRLAEFRAPTWSWASADYPVRAWNWPALRNPEISFMASVVDVTIIAHPEDRHKTGKVYGSRLEMKGRLRKVPSSCGPDTHDMFSHNVYSDTFDLRDFLNERSRLAREGRSIDDDRDIYYMPIRRIREMDHGHIHGLESPSCECGIVGLLVMRVDDTFERVGLFSMSAKHWRYGFRDTTMFDSEIFHYFDGCVEETVVFLDGVCRSHEGGHHATHLA